jgi:cell division protein FtsZ
MNELQFEMPTKTAKIIKVIGVGGGGGNAVSHMYTQGDINEVSFVLCNTDNQALNASEIPVKIQLGPSVTNGLGAGDSPEIAEKAAIESEPQIKEMLTDGTKMAFITAGMGGGTGTGAAPIIAKIAKSMNILTVGIVTIPFLFEGRDKILQALDGVEKIAGSVDALLVINNEKLRSIYPDLTWGSAFAKADDTLLLAAKSIADIITMHKKINLDFADVNTTLKDGGVAIMATGEAEGENRITQAINNALLSPLLSNKDIFNSKRVLLCVSFGPTSELIMEEIDEIHDFMKRFQKEIKVIWGGGLDNKLEGDKVKVTILATGFGVKDVADRDTILSKQQLDELREKEAEEKAKETKRIRKYYDNIDEMGGGFTHRRRQLFIFDMATLDDEDIIAKVESSPTFQRDKKTLNEIRQSVPIENLPKEEMISEDQPKNDDGVITF